MPLLTSSPQALAEAVNFIRKSTGLGKLHKGVKKPSGEKTEVENPRAALMSATSRTAFAGKVSRDESLRRGRICQVINDHESFPLSLSPPPQLRGELASARNYHDSGTYPSLRYISVVE